MELSYLILKYPPLIKLVLTMGAFLMTALINLTGLLLKKSVDRLATTIEGLQLSVTSHELRLTTLETTCKIYRETHH